MRTILAMLLCLVICTTTVLASSEDNSSHPDLNSTDVVMAVQKALNDAGYDCGKVDGIAGENTKNQISAYRSANNLGEGSDITIELIELLNIDSSTFEPDGSDAVSPAEDQTEGPKIVSDDTYYDATVIEFGSYEQDNDEQNGKEPIRWVVMKTDGQKAFLLSISALDVHPYHNESIDVTWADSDMRKWLNGDFYDSAFSDKQKAYVLTTSVDNSNSDGWGVSGGANTDDKVFLLSYGETSSIRENGRIRSPLTEYAKNKGAYDDDGCGRWFLRSPGNSLSNITVAMTAYGTHEAAGLDYAGGSVRPAIWIDASGLNL